MKLKKYINFIKENKEAFNSFGEWVESLIEDEYIKSIVDRFIKGIDPSINLSNAVNILDINKKNDLKYQIEQYLEKGIVDRDVDVVASAYPISSSEVEDLSESNIIMSGKGIFTSFLKSLTALGVKSDVKSDKCPSDFLLYYLFEDLDAPTVKSIFNRFKSLSMYMSLIDGGKNEVSLYYGLKSDGQLEYGIRYDDNQPIGIFKLSQSTINWITNIQSKSILSLKKELVNLTMKDILTLGRIKNDMLLFNPGYHEKKGVVTLSDRVLGFSFYGVGKWDNGKLDSGEFDNIKSNLNGFVLSKKWGDKVLISVKSNSFWVNIFIKIK